MNNISLNNSISIENNIDLTELIIIWPMPIFSYMILIFFIYSAKSKLIQTEFHILMIFFTYIIIFKIFITLYLIFYDLFHMAFGLCSDLVFSAISVVSWSSYSVTQIYYSLFQVSIVSRKKFFLKLFNFVHNTTRFWIFQIIFWITWPLGIATYSVLIYVKDNTCSYKQIIFLTSFGGIFPRILPCIIYLSVTMFACISRFRNNGNKYLSRTELQRFRKNVRLLLKFLVLTLISILKNLPTIFNYYVSYFNSYYAPSSAYKILLYAGILMEFIEVGCLIYVHDVLQNTFKNIFSRIFRKLF